MVKSQWVYRPQEVQKGDYWFSGRIYVSEGANQLLSDKAIQEIIKDVRTYAERNRGIGNLVVFLNKEQNQKVFFIDSLCKKEVEECIESLNYASLLLEEETCEYYKSIKEY